MIVYETIISLPRIQDRIKVCILQQTPYGYHDGLCWDTYRETNRHWNSWERIPAMSRAECRRFPKSVGYAANAILEQYRAEQKERP